MRIMKYLIIMVFLATLGISGFMAGGYLWVTEMSASSKPGHKTDVFIEPGTNQRQIAAILKQKKIIRSALLFRIYTRFLAVDQRLRPGAYAFNGSEPLREVIFKLLKGNMPTVQVTIPEGVTIKRVAAILQENGICAADEFTNAVSDPALIGRIFANWELIPAPEGLVFPDTYNFFRPSAPAKVAERMLRLMKHQIDRFLADSLPANLSQYEGCILASIVEAEAALAAERPLIASVFYNRLNKQIKLESCATVLYAIGEHKNRLLFEDLKIDSPFNTYRNPGLPPTPIANFGAASMQAVASPSVSDFLFFVSDGARGHKFSSSLNDHNKNRHEFYRRRKKENRQNEK